MFTGVQTLRMVIQSCLFPRKSMRASPQCAPSAFPYLWGQTWNGHPRALICCFQGVSCPYNPTPFACQPSPLPRSLVGCHLTSLLKLPSLACWQGCFIPMCSGGSCLFLAVLDHQKGSMIIKGNTLLLTPAVQLGLDPQNPPSLPTAFPFFIRIKEIPPKPPMSLSATSSTM